MINDRFCISFGAGFLPSTVGTNICKGDDVVDFGTPHMRPVTNHEPMRLQ